MIELHRVVDRQHDCSSDCFPNFQFNCWTRHCNLRLQLDRFAVPSSAIQLLNLALQIYLTEFSNWQAVTQNLGGGLLSDIFGISWLFLKIRGWDYNRAWDYTRFTTVLVSQNRVSKIKATILSVTYPHVMHHTQGKIQEFSMGMGGGAQTGGATQVWFG